jgi:CDP-diacylglycerol--glycerol-3-phosphate 3-phosphatidyltransferase
VRSIVVRSFKQFTTRLPAVLEQKIRDGWEALMRPIGNVLARMGLTPNMVTIVGVALQGAVTYLIVTGHLLIAGWVEIVAVFSDTWDGSVAKVTGKSSTFGALLDSTTDRVSDALFFLAIAWFYGVDPDPPHEGQHWVAIACLVALVATFLVSYIKARAEGLGVECKVGVGGRAERAIAMCVALVINPLLPAVVVLLALLGIVTALQRLLYVRKQLGATRAT